MNGTNKSLGKVGTLPDGRIILIRPVSRDGRPTMEIFNPKTREYIRIYYGKELDGRKLD